MAQLSLQQAALKRARDLAGGVSALGRILNVPANDLDAFIHGQQATPSWIFMRAVDFLNERETKATLELRYPPEQDRRGYEDHG